MDTDASLYVVPTDIDVGLEVVLVMRNVTVDAVLEDIDVTVGAELTDVVFVGADVGVAGGGLVTTGKGEKSMGYTHIYIHTSTSVHIHHSHLHYLLSGLYFAIYTIVRSIYTTLMKKSYETRTLPKRNIYSFLAERQKVVTCSHEIKLNYGEFGGTL